MSAILDFYSGTGTDHANRTLADVLKFDHAELEQGHDYIQWLFPLPEPSRFCLDAPLLTDEDIKEIAASPSLRWVAIGATARMAQFYLASPQWCTPRNHNLLRITRILRFLTLIGATDVAASFRLLVLDLATRHEGVVTEETAWFWSEALNPAPEFVR
jgi:hypothetical protein